MNNRELDVLNTLRKNPYTNQRILAEQCGCSLGMVNRSLKALQDAGNWTKLMVLQEEMKTMPFGDIWEEYCRSCGVPCDGEWFSVVRDYEKKIIEDRG